MIKKSVFFYANADKKIGSGHFWRCYYIANELLQYNIRVEFIYSALPSDFEEMLSDKNIKTHKLAAPAPENFINYIKNENSPCNPLVVIDSDDTFFYEAEFQLLIVNAGIGLMIITVNLSFHYYANILFNPNIISNYQEYSTESYTRKLLGPEYFIFNPQFRKINLQTARNIGTTIFVNFGSADPCGYTFKLVQKIIKNNDLNDFNFHIVLGSLNKEYIQIKELCEQQPGRFYLYHNVNNISEIMMKCDLGVCSPGLIFWELAVMGVKSILFSSSSREKIISEFLHERKFAYTFHHYDEIFSASKFNLFKDLLLNIEESYFENFQLLREKINPNGVSKVGIEIDNLLTGRI